MRIDVVKLSVVKFRGINTPRAAFGIVAVVGVVYTGSVLLGKGKLNCHITGLGETLVRLIIYLLF